MRISDWSSDVCSSDRPLPIDIGSPTKHRDVEVGIARLYPGQQLLTMTFNSAHHAGYAAKARDMDSHGARSLLISQPPTGICPHSKLPRAEPGPLETSSELA